VGGGGTRCRRSINRAACLVAYYIRADGVAEAEGADGPKTLPANPRVIIYRGARARARPRPDGPVAMTTGDNDHDRGPARPP